MEGKENYEREEIFSKSVRAGRRTYFFDVRSTRAEDYYLTITESKKFSISLLQESRGEEAGIKSSTLKISGDYCYGWLKRESGIHRLVRISPFDSNKRRHTSFASIWVYPEVDEKIEIEIKE